MPIMGILQFVRCRLGQHHRDRKRARRDGNGNFVSRCTGCDRRMIKDDGVWRLAADAKDEGGRYEKASR
jgi:hypothetical protein